MRFQLALRVLGDSQTFFAEEESSGEEPADVGAAAGAGCCASP